MVPEPKIALINPRMFLKSYRFYPLSLGYLAAALEKDQIPHSFYDLHIEWSKTSSVINQIKKDGIPGMFAVTGLLTSFKSVKEICESLKYNFPESQIVLGGRITVMDPEFIFKHIPTDFIIQGEGEIGLIQLINEINNNANYNSVQGLSYKDENGNVYSNGEADPVKNISDYNIPYGRFDMGKYIKLCNIQSPNVPSINMLSSRGCPFSCTFCNNSKGKKSVRFYDIKNLSYSLDYLIDKFCLKHVTFNDDIFTVNKRHMAEVCDTLKERNLTFSISTRLDFLDEESIQLLDESGCHYLCVGIESPSHTVAKIIDKKLDLKKHQRNIDILKKSRIVVNYGFMIGYLGETEKTIRETRDFVLKNKIIYSAFFTNAFPRTKLYDMIKDKIPNEEDYLKRLFTVDLSSDYLINMTDIPTKRLFRLRDELIVDSILNTIDIKIPLPLSLLRRLALLYLSFMRNYGLKVGFIKRAFEFINMSIVKPLTKNDGLKKAN